MDGMYEKLWSRTDFTLEFFFAKTDDPLVQIPAISNNSWQNIISKLTLGFPTKYRMSKLLATSLWPD